MLLVDKEECVPDERLRRATDVPGVHREQRKGHKLRARHEEQDFKVFLCVEQHIVEHLELRQFAVRVHPDQLQYYGVELPFSFDEFEQQQN